MVLWLKVRSKEGLRCLQWDPGPCDGYISFQSSAGTSQELQPGIQNTGWLSKEPPKVNLFPMLFPNGHCQGHKCVSSPRLQRNAFVAFGSTAQTSWMCSPATFLSRTKQGSLFTNSIGSGDTSPSIHSSLWLKPSSSFSSLSLKYTSPTSLESALTTRLKPISRGIPPPPLPFCVSCVFMENGARFIEPERQHKRKPMSCRPVRTAFTWCRGDTFLALVLRTVHLLTNQCRTEEQ